MNKHRIVLTVELNQTTYDAIAEDAVNNGAEGDDVAQHIADWLAGELDWAGYGDVVVGVSHSVFEVEDEE